MIALSGSSGFASPAAADPFGTYDFGTGTGPLADSYFHTYCWGPGFDVALRDNADYAMQTSLDGGTVMVDSYLSTCGASTTDIWFFDANLPGTVRGSYSCVTWISFEAVCDSSDVTLDPVQINMGSNDEEDTSKSACHEVGHSVGLTHGGSTDCMLSGEVPNANEQYRKLNSHHVSHIDEYFG